MTEDCKTCKQKGPSPFQYGTIIIGFYILSAAVYGTIEIIRNIVELIK